MTDTTLSTLSYESRRDSQSMLDYYVAEMIHCIQENPWASTPEIWDYITLGGPCVRRKNVMHLFGGMGQFKRTCRRMNTLRWAVIKHREDELPLGQEYETAEEIAARVRAGQRDEYIQWWSPNIWSIEPYDEAHGSLNPDRCLYYRPSPEDSDNFFEEESGDEVPSESSANEMEDCD